MTCTCSFHSCAYKPTIPDTFHVQYMYNLLCFVFMFCFKGQISSSFSFLVRKLWAGRYSAIVPQNFKTLLGFIYSQFNGFRQVCMYNYNYNVIVFVCFHVFIIIYE